jgi:poly-gamma-glutamate synthesis protein (capsule biosynthesis protein)
MRPRLRRRHRHAARQPRNGLLPGAMAVVVLGASWAWLAGRSSAEPPAVTLDPIAPPPTTAAPAPAAAVRDPVLGSGRSVTLAFAGDTNFEGANAERLAADPASVLAPVAPVLSAADLAMVNMETALGTGGRPAAKQFRFQAPPSALDAYRAAGVDVVSAANNHALDFGVDAVPATLAAERTAGVPVIGIGADETEAYAPFVAEVNGQRIAVLAATQVLDGNLVDAWTAGPGRPGLASARRVDRLVQAVQQARTAADTVVVFLHWGVERQTCPSRRQTTLARQLVDAGADVIVGSHAHRLQGGGMLGGAVVHYGLGNFAFEAHGRAASASGVFVVTVTGRRVDGYDWVPARIVDGQPRPLAGEDAVAARQRWDALRDCTDLAAA